MRSERLLACRFAGEIELLESLMLNESISTRLTGAETRKHQMSSRSRLFSRAVHVNLRLLPSVARSLERLLDRSELRGRVEVYVYEDPVIQAFVSEHEDHHVVVLSSGTVNSLSEHELEFVIGRELGRAIFGHLDVGVPFVLRSGEVDPRGCMQMRAWQRAAEISADRVGLISCGSLDVAATALFKTLSGLQVTGLCVSPAELADQWERLESRSVEGEAGERELIRPFPPLRMKAMIQFWQSGLAGPKPPAGPATMRSRRSIDDEVQRLLDLVDPLKGESASSSEPTLTDFLMWGGIYLALANEELHESELRKLATIVPKGALEPIIERGLPGAEHCLEQFQDCVARRKKRLRAVEIYRILDGLLQVAAADGEIERREIDALERLAAKLGVSKAGCEMVWSHYIGDGRAAE